MRDCRRNLTKIYYALYNEQQGKDEYGNTIGMYGEIQELHISLSVERGESSNEIFGQNVDYDREMVTTNLKCPINEYSRLWIGIDPQTERFNYIVKKVARSKNQVRYALKEIGANFNFENQVKAKQQRNQ